MIILLIQDFKARHFFQVPVICFEVFDVTYRTVEDFDDWTSWLMYKGGVGVKGDNSWESWWDEEQVCLVYICRVSLFA